MKLDLLSTCFMKQEELISKVHLGVWDCKQVVKDYKRVAKDCKRVVKSTLMDFELGIEVLDCDH